MIKKISIVIAAFVIAVLFTTSCEKETPGILKIALSKQKSENSTSKYTDWLLRHKSEIIYYNLYPMGIDSALGVLKTCDGLLLTGGEDVFPGYFGKIDDTARCGSIDRYRDSLEFALIVDAVNSNMPVFGVCRGEQILNISQGGTLYIDIPTDFDTLVKHRNPDWSRAYHSVELVNNTTLYDICEGYDQNDVVTSHHQGIEVLGNGLVISAYAEDSLPEAIEWSNKTNHGFLMAVQWHPEAMDSLHPLSAPLARKFLFEAEKFKNNN